MSNFLEVDPKLLENNFLLPGSSSNIDTLENLFNPNVKCSTENVPWKYSKPMSGCCVKTTDDRSNKIFINICHMNDIPEPKEMSDTELLELWQSEEISDYRVPLSIQEPHEELDKSGKPATVYDVAINTEFFKKMQKNAVIRSFVLQVVFEGIENKYNLSLKKEGYVILQNRKCIGELKAHRIRVQEGPYVPPKRLIVEMSESDKLSAQLKGDSKLENSKNVNYRFFHNTVTNHLIGEFHLLNSVKIGDIMLDVGEDRLVLESQKLSILMDLFIPAKIDESRVSAHYNRKNEILFVKMPVVTE